MTKVLDAHGLLVFLEKEPGFENVESSFLEAVTADSKIMMTSVNFGEVYYIILRECGKKKVEEIEKVIQALPIEIVDVDLNIAKQAAIFKVSGKMSYADCFTAALAKMYNGEIITGDKEFKAVESEIKIAWI